jgi:hypothetical protein
MEMSVELAVPQELVTQAAFTVHEPSSLGMIQTCRPPWTPSIGSENGAEYFSPMSAMGERGHYVAIIVSGG